MIQRAFRLAWAGPGFNTFSTRSRLAPCYLSGPTTVIFSPMHAVSPHGKKEFRKPRRRDVPTNYFLLFFFFPSPPFFFFLPLPCPFESLPAELIPALQRNGYNLCMELLIDSPHRFNDRFARYKEILSLVTSFFGGALKFQFRSSLFPPPPFFFSRKCSINGSRIYRRV